MIHKYFTVTKLFLCEFVDVLLINLWSNFLKKFQMTSTVIPVIIIYMALLQRSVFIIMVTLVTIFVINYKLSDIIME